MKPFVSVQVNAAGAAFGPAFTAARARGLTDVQSLSLDWSAVEKEPGKYASPFPAIAAAFYPGQRTRLLLILRPVNTARIEVPADLKGQAFDAPAMIDRFRRLLDWILPQLARTPLAGIALGNEVDGVFGTDAAAWGAYTRFFAQAARHVRTLRPDVPVGVCVQGSAWLGPAKRFLPALHSDADRYFVNYYPLHANFTVKSPAAIAAELSTILAAAERGGRRVVFTEIGCPSGARCGSSEATQAAFVRTVRALLARHTDRVDGALFQWLDDLPASSVEDFTRYYGVAAPAFAEFLATLGMRTREGQPKAAWDALIARSFLESKGSR